VLVAPSRLLLGLEIIVVGILLFAGSRRLGRIRHWAGWAAICVGCIFLPIGLAVGSTGFASGMQAAPLIINPVPADSASLQRGQQIYTSNCLSCHGATGAGDGPVSVSLNPPPANFQVHMAAGHTDGQLFDWITRGIPGSAMPSFGVTLTTQQRWDVINYVRTFAVLNNAKR
jgi:copper transport protein